MARRAISYGASHISFLFWVVEGEKIAGKNERQKNRQPPAGQNQQEGVGQFREVEKEGKPDGNSRNRP